MIRCIGIVVFLLISHQIFAMQESTKNPTNKRDKERRPPFLEPSPPRDFTMRCCDRGGTEQPVKYSDYVRRARRGEGR